jgi:hypothetical protein
MIGADPQPMWTEVIGAWASVATVALLLFGGGIAWWQATEARNLRRAQSRPFVVIDFDAQLVHLFIYLRLVNVGTTMARNVRFEFDPPIESTFDSDAGLPGIAELTIMKDGIRSLVPGKEIRFLFDAVLDRKKTNLADTYEVTVTYEGEERNRLLRKSVRESFKDTMVLDLSIYWNLTHITRHGEHDIHERLKEIGDLLKKWSASGGGLLALNLEDVRHREERWMERMREHEEERRAESAEQNAAEPISD